MTPEQAVAEVWDVVMGRGAATPQTARRVAAAIKAQSAEIGRLRAQVAAAWDEGHREGVKDGESGYVAGTERKLRWTPNPLRAALASGDERMDP